MAIFASDLLYHAVSEWSPKKMQPGDQLTPGRVSWAFYTEQAVADFITAHGLEKSRALMNGMSMHEM
jgi:hypothetical protein